MGDFKFGLHGKAYADPTDANPSDLLAPATTIALLATDGTPFGPTKWIIGDQKGTATIVDAAGHTITSFPITGTEQHVAVTALSSLSTTTKVWGAY